MFPQVLEEALDLLAPAGWAELSHGVGAQTLKQMKQEQQTPVCSSGFPVCISASLPLYVPTGVSASLVYGSRVDAEDWWL